MPDQNLLPIPDRVVLPSDAWMSPDTKAKLSAMYRDLLRSSSAITLRDQQRLWSRLKGLR